MQLGATGGFKNGGGKNYAPSNPDKIKSVRTRCPVAGCGAYCFTRSSDEISPESRRLYFMCSNFHCGIRFTASLTVEKVLTPSSISPNFRPAVLREARAPGHEFGQQTLFELTDPPDSGGNPG